MTNPIGTPPRRRVDGLTITTSNGVDGTVVLIVSGSLDFYARSGFVAAVRQALDGGATTIRADLSDVGFCDTSGLAALVRAHKAAQAVGRRLVLSSPGHALNRIFVLTGLDTVLHITTMSLDEVV